VTEASPGWCTAKPAPQKTVVEEGIARILSHNADAGSPFAVALSTIASCGELAIACPYIHLDVLRGLVAAVDCWRLLTDLPEWLAATPAANRAAAAKFISQHLDKIRDVDGLHAKLVLGDDAAYLGSANLTMAGLGRNHELGVMLDQPDELADLSAWYDGLWSQAQQRTRSDVERLAAVIAKHDAPERLSERVRSSWDALRSQRPSKSLTAILSRAQANPYGNSTSAHTFDDESWQRLVERVSLSPGRWWADRFFDLAADLLETTGLESGDPRLVTSIPRTYNRLSVSVNNRYVLTGMWKGERDFGLMVGMDYQLPADLQDQVVYPGYGYSSNSHESDDTVPRFLAFDIFPETRIPTDLLEQWRFYVELEKEHRSGSMHQQYHEPVVCQVAQDRELRTHLLHEAFGA
jgi:hypothetical protein